MTSHLPSNEIELFRSLKKTAILLMLLFRLDKPVGESQIAQILDIHPETTRIYLRSLARLGLVTRTHRFNGWTLTAGGRQMILGEGKDPWPVLGSGKIKTSAENPRSIPESPPASAEIPRSRPVAAASLSFKQKRNTAAAAIAAASVKISPSRYSRRWPNTKKKDRTATGSTRSDPLVRANLEAFAAIGLVRNDFVLEICKMDHVTPDYILGQAKRLEAERRYSHGLLLTVIRSHDHLPEKYLPRPDPLPQSGPFETGQEPEDEPVPRPDIEPDPSICEPMSSNGITPAGAWSAALGQLKRDMPKAAYDKWVRDALLLSAGDAVFVIAAPDAFARDWLESRLSTTVTRFLKGVCNRPVSVRFVEIKAMGYSRQAL
jgi:hypothetical protein